MATPHPTPTETLLARGSWRGKARAKQGEPKPPKGRLKRPDWLSAHARKAWDKYRPICEKMGVLTVADHHAFTIMCCALGETEWAYENLAMASVNGHLSPELELMTLDKRTKMSNYALNQAALAGRLMKCFGLTPSARGGLRVPQPEADEGGALAKFKKSGKKKTAGQVKETADE